jgi:hypothetical protein
MKEMLEVELTEDCCIEASRAKQYSELLVEFLDRNKEDSEERSQKHLLQLTPLAWIRVGLVGMNLQKDSDSSSAARKLLAERIFAASGHANGLKVEAKKESVQSAVNCHSCFWAEEADDFLLVQVHNIWTSWKRKRQLSAI